ncbi:MAG: hypothetical protein ACMUIL_07905 [bacterium]
MMKTYRILVITGLLAAGMCFCMCATYAHAEPLARVVRPERPDTQDEPEYVARTRMRTIADWETTTDFSLSQMRTKIEAAADALKDAQDGSTMGWAFYLPGGSTASNIYGVVGLGLLRAYNLTKTMTATVVTANKPEYLAAAEDTADAILAGSFPWQATDYTFLHYYAEVSGDSSYKTTAESDLDSDIIDGNTPAEVADWLDSIDDGQGKLWQLANWVEVFQLYSESDYADAVVDKIMDRYRTVGSGADKVGGFVYNTVDNYVRTLDQARVVEVLKRFYSSTYPTHIAEGLALLKDLQYNNGYFRWGCQLNNATGRVTLFPSILVQDQAFAVKALAYNNQTTSTNFSNHFGTHWAANALMDMQNTSGGFTLDPDPDESSEFPNVSEYNAEALDALHASCGEGDVDRSGQLFPWDALDALKAYLGMIDLNGPALVAADRDGDNQIAPADALAILQASVGKAIEVNPGDNVQ